MTCFPATTLNPFNQGIVDVFGANFFPPFNIGGQPADKETRVNEKLLNFPLPGGSQHVPDANIFNEISKTIGPVIQTVATVMAGIMPIFIVIEVIRGIIEIICSLFNPTAMVAAIVNFFQNILPKLFSLLPPAAGILLLLAIIQTLVAVLVAMLSAIIPIIEQINECGIDIPIKINEGDFASADGCVDKICQLLQYLLNEIGALAPLTSILNLIDVIMNMVSGGFCATGSDCCTCDDVLANPPSGQGIVSQKTDATLLSKATTKISTTLGAELDQLSQYVGENNGTYYISLRIDGTLYGVASCKYGEIVIYSDDFEVNDIVNFEIVPNEEELMINGKITAGCMSDIVAAKAAAENQRKNDSQVDDSLAKVLPSFPKFDSLKSDLLTIHTALSEDPTLDLTADANRVITDYILDVTDFYSQLVCIGASRTGSEISSSSAHGLADGSSPVELSLKIANREGANLLAGQIPNTNFKVEFITTLGTVTPAYFDPRDSLFKASLVTNNAGTANVTAVFLVNNRECMRPAIFDGTQFIERTLSIEFIEPAGRYPRRRREREYTQSAGGRRRP